MADWLMVPLIPTRAMVEAGARVAHGYPQDVVGTCQAEEVWDAMLSAYLDDSQNAVRVAKKAVGDE